MRQTPEEELEKHLMKAIIDDPLIRDKTNISVKHEDGDLHLIGKVGSEDEKQRVEEIVKVNTREEKTIVNELTVG
ncbi:MAG: BON domain-containing protein [Spirochaetia bacterium]